MIFIKKLSFVLVCASSFLYSMQQLPSAIQTSLSNAAITNQVTLSDNNLAALTNDQFQLLMETIELLPQLDHLRISICHLDRLSQNAMRWARFNDMLQRTRIAHLDLSGNRLSRISNEAMETLAHTLIMMPVLEELNLSVNSLGAINPHNMNDVKLTILANAFPNMRYLKNLNLGTNGIGELNTERLTILFSGIALIPQLESLNLDFNNIGLMSGENIVLLCSKLGTISTLRYINLVENDFVEASDEEFSNAVQAFHLLGPSVFLRFGRLPIARITLLNQHRIGLR